MALFYQHTINDNTKLGVWQIEESEAFFLMKVPLQREISHPHKRLQHLAGRYLLQYLFSDFPYDLMGIADTRKPFLTNEAYHFSISHCGNFAAAIVSKVNRVGVDIEQVKPIIQKIKHKFLTEAETGFLVDSQAAFQIGPSISPNSSSHTFHLTSHSSLPPSPNSDFLTLAWSAKEAIYKWYGFGGVDFRKNIQLRGPLKLCHDNRIEGHYSFKMDETVDMDLISQVIDDLVMTYVIT